MYTEPLFVYAGHTMRLRLSVDSVYAQGEDTLGLYFEIESVSSRALIENAESLGIYPKHFAELEANESLTNQMTVSKNTPLTLSELEAEARFYIQRLIGQNVFDKVAN